MGTIGDSCPPEPELLYQISSLVSSALTVDEILRELIRLAAAVTRSDACLVYLPEPDGGDLVLRASQLQHAEEVGRLRLRAGEGITGWVAERGSVAAIPHSAYRDERFKKFSSLVEDTYEAVLSAPLLSGGAVIGVINVHHKDPHPHSREEVAMVMFLGQQIGGLIAKARLEEENLEMQRQLETRKLIERAKGVLQRTANLTEEEAYLRLRNESRRTRRPMKELAEAILLADSMGRG